MAFPFWFCHLPGYQDYLLSLHNFRYTTSTFCLPVLVFLKKRVSILRTRNLRMEWNLFRLFMEETVLSAWFRVQKEISSSFPEKTIVGVLIPV
jgi:hypothetical protein